MSFKKNFKKIQKLKNKKWNHWNWKLICAVYKRDNMFGVAENQNYERENARLSPTKLSIFQFEITFAFSWENKKTVVVFHALKN